MTEFVNRKIFKEIKDNIFKWKIIIIYWPRQVGKTTLVKILLSKYWSIEDYYNCDEPDIRLNLTNKTSTELKSFFWNKKLIVIDEAQRVENIWVTLKLLIDNYPDIQIIATWSSSFDLANKINEPLTWRKYEFHLYPFSIEELSSKYSKLELKRFKDENMIFGLYPEIFFSSKNDKIKNLKTLVDSYLYKDILSFWNIRKPDIIIKLLQVLAIQVWNQVSYNELANLIWVDKNTIENYIIILEKAFIIFRLWSFSRNLRNEIKFSKKIYFYDLWVRNTIINNFNPLELRQDIWALWENFIISEKMKYNSNNFLYVNSYFWRTFAQQEIDYIEESWDKLFAYEIKYSANKKVKPFKSFIEAYPKSNFEIVNQDNYLDYII